MTTRKMMDPQVSVGDDATQPGGPLAGLTIVESATMVLGPLAAQLLGDMGADVIKIEPPGGDLTRNIGPRKSDDMGAFFLSNNRNKRSITLDLKLPDAQEVMSRLIAQSDVFLHSVRTSAAKRLRITYADLSARNGRLVYCHVNGFADDGPYGGKPAYDDIVQALSGLASLQSVVGGEPRYMPAIFADKITAVHAAYAVSLALLHRERTGMGQAIDIPMFETMVQFNMAEHLWGHAFEPPIGAMGYESISTAARRPFRTRDGYVSFLPYSDRHWRRFFELIDRMDVMEDPRFATFAARQQHVPLVWNEVAQQMTLRTTREWRDLLEQEDLPFAVVNSLEDLTTDPHLTATGFWQFAQDPVDGLLRFPGNPLGLQSSPPRISRLPPRLGADTADVLSELHFSPEEIEDLARRGVTRTH
jgi:crotonobetainyl-CoA:carnitine CoA-transferase CaiB-like acyl-CoA transferase